jgi:hypothetical protein
MTRTLKFSVIALLAVVVLWACGGASGPKAVGEKFLNAIAKGDIDGAKKFATKESESALALLASTAEEKKAKPDKIEVGEVKEEGDKATLSYKENGTDKTLNLVKEGADWKVAYTKGGGENSLDKIGEDLGNAVGGAMDSLAGGAADSASVE